MNQSESHFLSSRHPLQRMVIVLATVTTLVQGISAAPVQVKGPREQAPPPFPPILMRSQEPVEKPLRPLEVGTTLYSIGQPTEEEQLYVELINRARANPAAEGERLRATTDPEVVAAYDFFSVDLELMVAEFAAIDPAPPVAVNAQLLEAARLHSADMFANEFQGHSGSDGSTLGQRVTAQGYPWSSLAENVYSYAKSVWHGHAGFNVDWGAGGAGGMQLGRGHRVNIHNPGSREIGVGVVLGEKGSVGPQLVTQDFGTRQGATPLLTGVVYYDLNRNDFFDPGEGLGGITVFVDGSSFYAMTADTGGYAVPVPGNGSYLVTFRGPGLPEHEQTITVAGLRNEKLDHQPPYSPPVVAGPDPALLGGANHYSFTEVGGAMAHQVEQTRLVAYTRVEGAEDGLDHVTVVASPGYEVVSTTVRASGTRAFHLAHPSAHSPQILTLNAVLRPVSTSVVTFQSRLGWASVNQMARVEVTTDGGQHWEPLWTQAGTGTQGQTSFELISLPLAPFEGKPLQLRFVYDHRFGSYFFQTDDGVGWYIDDIAFSDVEVLFDPVVFDVPGGNSFVFSPATLDNHSLRVRGQLPGERYLPWGPLALVSVIDSGPPIIRFVAAPELESGWLALRFMEQSGVASTFGILEAEEVEGLWQPVEHVTLNEMGDGQFEARLPLPLGSRRFYRVVLQE
jgi:hypothetical protein